MSVLVVGWYRSIHGDRGSRPTYKGKKMRHKPGFRVRLLMIRAAWLALCETIGTASHYAKSAWRTHWSLRSMAARHGE